MKKIYQTPQLEVTEVEKTSVICTSVKNVILSTTGVDGSAALSKERDFDDFDEEEDDEW